MESVTIKLHENIAKEIEALASTDYGTKTDFIREAIRDKLKQIRKEHALRELDKFFGSVKTKVSDKRHEEIREEVGRKFAEKFGIKLD